MAVVGKLREIGQRNGLGGDSGEKRYESLALPFFRGAIIGLSRSGCTTSRFKIGLS